MDWIGFQRRHNIFFLVIASLSFCEEWQSLVNISLSRFSLFLTLLNEMCFLDFFFLSNRILLFASEHEGHLEYDDNRKIFAMDHHYDCLGIILRS